MDDAGHIVTNAHVVSGGEEFAVRLYDGRTLPAKMLGTSPADDLALLEVDPVELDGIGPLPLADSSKVSPGQFGYRHRQPLPAAKLHYGGRGKRCGAKPAERPAPPDTRLDSD